MRPRSLPLLLASLLPLAAQQPPGPIQDNSFLLEEAYNQEPNVIQHISAFTRLQQSGDWIYTFTEEWPVGGLSHQLSLTVPLQRAGAAPDGGSGVGDLALNYRYQLLGDGEARVALAPRFTLLLPTGSAREGRGSGHLGYQANLPLSLVLTERWVAHTNLGYTWTPQAQDPAGNRADLGTWNAGQSLVWLVRPDFNVMLELACTRGQAVAGPGLREPVRSAYLAPGIRWAWNLPRGLQVVPGLAALVGVGPSRGEKGVFLYLSFEHPLP